MISVFKLNGGSGHIAVYGLAVVGHLKKLSRTFAQMPNRSTNVEFTTVCPTIAKPMLAVVFLAT
jgi:hypothetical protein